MQYPPMQSRRFLDSEGIFEFLMGFVNVEKGQKTEFKLDRMRDLAERLGNPQDSYATIHVAGSKGKGSVSTMIARILEASGLKTGLYTSPHLLRWKERISLAGDEMPEALLIESAESLLPLVEGKGPESFLGGELPTYFELTTLLGFDAFRRAGCEAAVVETGLGGRLDSTNIVSSRASVITPIELEHTEWLGDTIPQIAGEKAGIIKAGRPCLISRQRPEAQEVFRRVARERGSPLKEVSELVELREVSIDRRGTAASLYFRQGKPFSKPIRVRSPLVGTIQAENMGLAILAAAELLPELSAEAVVAGLAKARLPARFEILEGEPPVVLDGAHTPASIKLGLESFNRLFPGPGILVFACAHDKKHKEMAKILGRRFNRIIVTRPGTFKQSLPEAVFASFSAENPGTRLIPDTAEAIRCAREEALHAGLPLLVTGSFYLCSEAAKLLGAGAAGA